MIQLIIQIAMYIAKVNRREKRVRIIIEFKTDPETQILIAVPPTKVFSILFNIHIRGFSKKAIRLTVTIINTTYYILQDIIFIFFHVIILENTWTLSLLRVLTLNAVN